MANPYAGEVRLVLDGSPHVLKLTLGALAELESSLGSDSLVGMSSGSSARPIPAATCWR